MSGHTDAKPAQGFQEKIWMTTGILALVLIALLLFKTIFNVLLLAGIIIARLFSCGGPQVSQLVSATGKNSTLARRPGKPGRTGRGRLVCRCTPSAPGRGAG